MASTETASSPDLSSLLKSAYRYFELDYPKFFKMDRLSKLAFMAAEILFGAQARYMEKASKENIHTTRQYPLKNHPRKTEIPPSYYPIGHRVWTPTGNTKSPSPTHTIFTQVPPFSSTPLPNICIGEISIRHRLRSENSFFIFNAFDAGVFKRLCRKFIKHRKRPARCFADGSMWMKIATRLFCISYRRPEIVCIQNNK